MIHAGLHPLDWTLVAIYCLGMIGVGYFYSRRKTDTSDYFLGGSMMSSWVIGVSLFATLFSTISYLSMPGEMIKNGPSYLFVFAAIPLSYIVVGRYIIPALMRQRVVSAYELLEQKLGRGVRTFGATLFITLRLVWMTVLIYMASSAIAVIVGLRPEQTFYVILVTGSISVLYTTMGGLRAVAVSDVIQSLFLFLGAIATLAIASWHLKGFSWLPTEWDPEWQPLPLFSFDPHVRITVFGVILMNFLWHVCTAGGDQTAIQRYMSTRNAATARRAFLVHSAMGIVVSLLVCAIGFALLGYYREFGELLPEGETTATYADFLFPMFISHQLPIGLSGLVVAALVAAAMSSLDSGVNSITAVIWRDILGRGQPGAAGGGREMRGARGIALMIGLVVILLGSQVGNVPGNFLEVTKKTTNLFAPPIFGLFFLALFVKRADGFGAVLGTVYGFTAAVLVAYWDVLTGLRPISFMWIMPSALVVQLTIAFAASGHHLPPQRRSRITILACLPIAAIFIALALR